MITNLLLIILSSLFTLGWQYSTMYEPENADHKNPFGTQIPTDKEIAWWFRYYIGNLFYRYLPYWKGICKPLFMCIVCMGGFYSFWISVIYHIINQTPLTWHLVLSVILVTICTAGLNRIIRTNL
jgi:hypothetical protein